MGPWQKPASASGSSQGIGKRLLSRGCRTGRLWPRVLQTSQFRRGGGVQTYGQRPYRRLSSKIPLRVTPKIDLPVGLGIVPRPTNRLSRMNPPWQFHPVARLASCNPRGLFSPCVGSEPPDLQFRRGPGVNFSPSIGSDPGITMIRHPRHRRCLRSSPFPEHYPTHARVIGGSGITAKTARDQPPPPRRTPPGGINAPPDAPSDPLPWNDRQKAFLGRSGEFPQKTV